MRCTSLLGPYLGIVSQWRSQKICHCPSTVSSHQPIRQTFRCFGAFAAHSNDVELSPHYRQDIRDHSQQLPPIQDPVGLTLLLEQRYQAAVAVRRTDHHGVASSDHNDTMTARQPLELAELDTQLKQRYGVRVYEQPPIWTRVWVSPPLAQRRNRADKIVRIMQRAFGATGHGYDQVGRHRPADTNDSMWLDCDLTMTEIHTLLSRYTRSRLAWQHEAANAIRFELQMHGVRLCDASLQWTLDSEFDEWPTMGHDDALYSGPLRHEYIQRLRQRGKSLALSLTEYQYSPAKEELELMTVAMIPLTRPAQRTTVPPVRDPDAAVPNVPPRIAQLVRNRSIALQRGETALVNSLTYELDCTYNVVVDDVSQTWRFERTRAAHQSKDTRDHVVASVTRMKFPSALFEDERLGLTSSVRYRCSGLSQVCEVDQERVETLIQERVHKREEGRFVEADAIRRELWYTYNVGINDRLQQYSIGGVFDESDSMQDETPNEGTLY